MRILPGFEAVAVELRARMRARCTAVQALTDDDGGGG